LRLPLTPMLSCCVCLALTCPFRWRLHPRMHRLLSCSKHHQLLRQRLLTNQRPTHAYQMPARALAPARVLASGQVMTVVLQTY
jgi:hypothetical protein